jgi:leader peptidase (prepilin peptidase)/N-methyltransferase
MQVVFFVFMFILGACFGSFLCCEARRLRLKETHKKPLGHRSVCLSCKHQLTWNENIPLISWLIQKGKCKKCGKKIGIAEFISELGVALAFLAMSIAFSTSFGSWDSVFAINTNTIFAWCIFAVTLLLVLSLCFLAIYDGLYGELPSLFLWVSIILAFALVTLKLWSEFSVSGFAFRSVLDIIFAIAILGGIYLVLYLVSKGKWVGDGDWILGSIIAAVLGTPWLALVALFIANFSACVIMYPAVRKQKDHKVFFGPFLVFAFIVTFLISSCGIIDLW